MGDYCHKRVEVGINGWTRKCGDYYAGAKVFCLECQEKYEKQYPQGWVAYPGDVCKHGFYTGGSGVTACAPGVRWESDMEIGAVVAGLVLIIILAIVAIVLDILGIRWH